MPVLLTQTATTTHQLHRHHRLWTSLLWAVLTMLILLITLLSYANYIINQQHKYTYNYMEAIPANKVGVVLGTSKYLVGGGINQYFLNRINATADLYFSGKIQQIIVSGDNATSSYNEPREMRRELLKRGIPPHDIYSDYAGFRTLDSILRANGVFGQRSFTVISQQFQNERAIYLGRHYNIDIIGFNAQDVAADVGIKTQIREIFARLWCMLDLYLFNSQPRYMGQPVEVE
jgi:SanA protein